MTTTKYRFMAGEQIDGDTLCIGYQSADDKKYGMALAVNIKTGDISYGDPLLGTSHIGTLSHVPKTPEEGSSASAWQRWAKRTRAAIASEGIRTS